MNIAIVAPVANQIRAYKNAHPGAKMPEIARHFGVQPVLVKNALERPGRRRIKSVAR